MMRNISLTMLVLAACSVPVENTTGVSQELCQPTDESCVTLAQSRAITRDYAQNVSGGSVNTAQIGCAASHGPINGAVGFTCVVEFTWNGIHYWVACDIWSDVKPVCESGAN